MSRRGWLLFTAMAVLWGIPYLFIKVAVGQLTPITLVFLRTGAAAVLLLPVALGTRSLRGVGRRWGWLLAYTFIEMGVPWVLLSDSERRLSSSLAGLLVAAVPLVGALLAQVTASSDRVGARDGAGLLVGFAGVAALVGLDIGTSDLGAAGEMAIVTVCYAVGPMIIARKLADVPTVGVVTLSLAVVAVVYAVPGILQFPRVPVHGEVIVAVAVLAAPCTALAFLLFFALIAEAGPVRATVITYVNPAIALAVGILFLSERLTPGKVIGFVLILAGSVLSTRRPAPARNERVREAREPVAAEVAAP